MIERMEDYVLTGMGVPFTPFTVVNGEKLVPLLDRIRENLPAEIQHAQRVLERRDEIVTDAQNKANQVLQDAKKQSEFMLSESELLRAVHEEAGRIRQQITLELEAMRKKAFEEAEAVRAQAAQEAASIRDGADQYAEAILGSLEKNLTEFQTVVRNGQRYLKKTRMEALQQTAAAQTMPPALHRQEAYYGAESYQEPAYVTPAAAADSYAQEFLKQTTLSNQ
jgi:vacuolar-type H+-ATPase subunit H